MPRRKENKTKLENHLHIFFLKSLFYNILFKNTLEILFQEMRTKRRITLLQKFALKIVNLNH